MHERVKSPRSHLRTAVCSWRWGWRSRSPRCLCGGAWCRKTRGPEHWASAGEVAWGSRSPALGPFPEPPPLLLLWNEYTGAHTQVCVCVRGRVHSWVVVFSFLTAQSGVSVCSGARKTRLKVMKPCFASGYYKQSQWSSIMCVRMLTFCAIHSEKYYFYLI